MNAARQLEVPYNPNPYETKNPIPLNRDADYNRFRQEQVDELQAIHKRSSEKELRNKRAMLFVKAAVAILAVFSVLSFVVSRYAMINEVKYNIYSYKKEINALNIQIEELNTQLDGSIVLENIERQAIEELGMQYPQPEQIVYLNSHWNYSLDGDETIVIANNTVEEPLIDEHTVNKVKSFAVKIDDVINKK